MLDPKMFTVERLLAAMFDTAFGNRNPWWVLAEIVPAYMPPYLNEWTRPKCVVRCGESFLRYSVGPQQGYFWDGYGDDFHTPELALLALREAPIPPGLISRKAWTEIRLAKEGGTG